MSQEVDLLTEIRDLLEVIAEPALAKRDAKLRASLREIIGGSAKRTIAVQLMDGVRSQATISKESGLDQGNVSRLVKALVSANLIVVDGKNPRLSLKLSPRFFEEADADEQ